MIKDSSGICRRRHLEQATCSIYAISAMKNICLSAMAIALAAVAPASLFATESADSTSRYLRDPVPGQWLYTTDHTQPSPTSDRWWTQFADSTLNSLITKAENENFNVAAALKRIELARHDLDITRAGYWPGISASGGWSRNGSAGATAPRVKPSSSSSAFSLGLDMNWEIDVFGRIAAQSKADKAAIAVSRADYDAVMVSLCAEVASTYMQLRVFQRQYQVALDHIASQEKILKITEARFEAGIGDMLEVTQAKIVLYSTQSTLPLLEAQIRSAANSLAVLTGQYPAALAPRLLSPAPIPREAGIPAVGIPADLLRRRPDIVEAEMQLARYAALVGVAKKDFLPTLSLSGSIATEANNIKNIFGAHSLSYSISPTLSWTVFDGLARNYRTAEARLDLEQAIDNYNITVLNSVEEVENSLSDYDAAVEQFKILTNLTEESRNSLELSLDLYKQGLTAFSNVVDAQQNYLEYQNQLVVSKGKRLTSLISLYKALGGGF